MKDPNDPNYRPTDHRMIGLVLTGVAILLMAYATISQRWLEQTNFRGTTIGFSLRSLELCLEDSCESRSNFAVIAEAKRNRSKNASAMFAPMGVATTGLLALAVISMGITAAVAYRRQRPTLAVPPHIAGLFCLMGALITGCIFIATKPGGLAAVGVGPGFWAFGLGSVLGIAGSQVLGKLIKPIDPDLPPDPFG